jgi:hypothetical protein
VIGDAIPRGAYPIDIKNSALTRVFFICWTGISIASTGSFRFTFRS